MTGTPRLSLLNWPLLGGRKQQVWSQTVWPNHPPSLGPFPEAKKDRTDSVPHRGPKGRSDTKPHQITPPRTLTAALPWAKAERLDPVELPLCGKPAKRVRAEERKRRRRSVDSFSKRVNRNPRLDKDYSQWPLCFQYSLDFLKDDHMQNKRKEKIKV